MRVICAGLICAAVLVALCPVPPAEAHTRRRSYSAWTWNQEVAQFVFRFDERSVAELLFGPGLERGTMTRKSFELLTRLPPQLLRRGMSVTQAGEPCPLALSSPIASRQGSWFVIRGRYQCPEAVLAKGVEIHSSLLPGSSLDHVHFMRWRVLEEGRLVDEGHTALGLGSRNFTYAGGGGAKKHQSLTAMVAQGVLHVLLGYDHLAFLMTLILVSWFLSAQIFQAAGELLRLALGFTLGHSLTLGLAASDTVQVAESTVEFLIAMSVAGLAFEGLLRGREDTSKAVDEPRGAPERRWTTSTHSRPGPAETTLRPLGAAALLAAGLGALTGAIDHSPFAVVGMAVFLAAHLSIRKPGPWARATLATVFGLVHGFGFAGALSELDVGGQHLLVSLFGFNLGVELGQWVAIVLVLSLLALPAKHLRRPLFEWGCGAMLWLGLFWMAQRAF